jgi:hypothetical protein
VSEGRRGGREVKRRMLEELTHFVEKKMEMY